MLPSYAAEWCSLARSSIPSSPSVARTDAPSLASHRATSPFPVARSKALLPGLTQIIRFSAGSWSTFQYLFPCSPMPLSQNSALVSQESIDDWWELEVDMIRMILQTSLLPEARSTFYEDGFTMSGSSCHKYTAVWLGICC